jgi:uncharacterized membrane protein HdeD (DUF308 family)
MRLDNNRLTRLSSKDSIMLQALCSKWWCLTLRGLCALIAGIISVMHPALTIAFLVILIGVSALLDGLTCVFMGIGGGGQGRPWWEMILLGLVGVGFGIATIAFPPLTEVILLSMIAGWSIARGLLQMVAAVRLRKEIDDEWLLFLDGAVSVLFGGMLIYKPVAGMLAIGMVIGFFLIVIGAVAIALSFRLRSVHQKMAHAG